MDPVQAANAALTTIGKVIDYVKTNITSHASDNSLTKLTKLTRMEPITIISQDLANIDYLPTLLNNICSMYAGYILQAVSIMSNASANIEVIRILDAINPNRDSTGFLLQSRKDFENLSIDLSQHVMATESYTHSLPTKRIVMAREEAARQQDTIKVLYEMENLAVGKLINVDVNITDKDCPDKPRVVTIPVSVRLSPVMLNEDSLNYLFTYNGKDNGIVERWHSWRAGRIELIRDMIFGADLIKEYRKAALQDKSGTLTEIMNRVNAQRSYGLLTKNPSMSICSNVYVISKEEAQRIEGVMGYKFSDVQGREKIFNGKYEMITAVVDTERELITFYFNGIAQPATMSVRAIKASSKSKGPDVGDIMRTLMEGRAPTF